MYTQLKSRSDFQYGKPEPVSRIQYSGDAKTLEFAQAYFRDMPADETVGREPAALAQAIQNALEDFFSDPTT